ncbi:MULTISPECIES: EthD family reductase [unclassified Sphingopyxis]|uniref:EthD family reductase n=1 Tax=unclassified Sphingopyxis TaxID=2614943 RepID=UPI00285955B5|nr:MULTISPECIES: EthD family reductase [unclassified Sphingopyxis]MDR6832447.1 uncharacterized protein (TIGR02118 family) [Sphingopyxis sp. BE122]MDR7228190.1 uncharacterized protein (TIGR02118 family) [Sphingopyxis sp. BE259]
MKKLIALYLMPDDEDAFMDHYRSVHMPLVNHIPGLVRTELTRIDRTLMGEDGAYLLAEMVFVDEDAFRQAMRSPENAAAGADIAKFAKGRVTVMTGTAFEC